MSQVWEAIEEYQQALGWSTVLDAGTGHSSLGWLTRLECQVWTAVTASPKRYADLQADLGASIRLQDRLVLGNWLDEQLLDRQCFDVVVAHYLLGALERYSPYFEFALLKRLRRHASGRLYFVGMEPSRKFASQEEHLMHQLFCFRDACYLHAGSRGYREYPMNWVQERLGECGFRTLETAVFPNIYGENYLEQFFNACRYQLAEIGCPELRAVLEQRADSLHASTLEAVQRHHRLRAGFDYLIVAEAV
ncbi:MAG: class I SAM-dependent methyltransferase [Vulcanimicrobiota bacterium]